MNLFLLDPFGRSRESSVKCISCKSPRLFTESSSKLFHIGNEIAPGALMDVASTLHPCLWKAEFFV